MGVDTTPFLGSLPSAKIPYNEQVMFILENVPLSGYSTMRLGGTATYLTEINERSEIAEALTWAKEKNVPVRMIGGGSNIIWRDEGYPGLVLVNRIRKFEILSEDEENIYIILGAGENWDEVVAKTVEMDCSGLEELSLIPGTVGGTPIQNVGAYGKEIKDTLVAVEAYDTTINALTTIAAYDCNFSYRSSRFKTTDNGRFFITSITVRLNKNKPTPPFYQAITDYLNEHGIHEYTPATIRNAVIKIREQKLPNPTYVANNGSFFANPIITNDQLVQLRADYPEIKYWELDDKTYKISGAWLIEGAGFKGVSDKETGMAVWPQQALVLVNEHAPNTAALLAFKQKIVDAVQTKYGITLEQEPELLP